MTCPPSLIVALALQVSADGRASADVLPRALPREERTVRAGGHTWKADVGRVLVLADRREPAGARIELAVARLFGAGPADAAPIVFLAGGPGPGATRLLQDPGWAPYLALGDVLLVDQRGIGRSLPLLAVEPEGFDARVLFGERAPAEAALLGACERAAQEMAGKGIDLCGYTTSASADDVADVLAALGLRRARILAHSYGTHWALELLRRHPGLVERCALLGVAGPDDLLKPAGELEPFVDALARRVAQDPGLRERLPDLRRSLAAAIERARREPFRVRFRDQETGADVELAIGAFGLQRILLYDLGDASDLVVFPRLLVELAAGDTSTLAWFARKRHASAGRVDLAAFALRGSSGVSAARRERIAADARTSPFEDARNFPYPAVLDALGIRAAPDAFRAPVTSAVPCLLVSGTLDASTPAHQADAVARGLERCGRLVVDDAGHDDLLDDGGVRARVAEFLGGAPPRDGRLALGVRAFAPLEGASDLHPALAGR